MLLFQHEILILVFLEGQRLEKGMEFVLKESLYGISFGEDWEIAPAFF